MHYRKLIACFALFGLLCLTACDQSKKAETKTDQTVATVYTCPMHPEVTSDKPGNCPKCGMELVPQEDAATADTSHTH
jgi:membrane fusion protein, copper/silver efflux system